MSIEAEIQLLKMEVQAMRKRLEEDLDALEAHIARIAPDMHELQVPAARDARKRFYKALLQSI